MWKASEERRETREMEEMEEMEVEMEVVEVEVMEVEVVVAVAAEGGWGIDHDRKRNGKALGFIAASRTKDFRTGELQVAIRWYPQCHWLREFPRLVYIHN